MSSETAEHLDTRYSERELSACEREVHEVIDNGFRILFLMGVRYIERIVVITLNGRFEGTVVTAKLIDLFCRRFRRFGCRGCSGLSHSLQSCMSGYGKSIRRIYPLSPIRQG